MTDKERLEIAHVELVSNHDALKEDHVSCGGTARAS